MIDGQEIRLVWKLGLGLGLIKVYVRSRRLVSALSRAYTCTSVDSITVFTVHTQFYFLHTF
jgi:hypothetical protein